MEKTKRFLITGENGFLARNVVKYFSDKYECIAVSHNDSKRLSEACKVCDFVFHLAAVQRSENDADFWTGNVGYTQALIEALEASHNYVPVLFSTSIGIDKPSIFAETKLEAERLLRKYSRKYNIPVYIFKLNHIFGQWGKPDFNNVIATFCNNVANQKPIIIYNPGAVLDFTYVEDLMEDFNRILEMNSIYRSRDNYLTAKIQYRRTLGEVVMSLGNAVNNQIPQDEFEKKLYKTLSFYRTGDINAAGNCNIEL